MAPALALRPQLFGILLFAGLVWLVADREAHPRGCTCSRRCSSCCGRTCTAASCWRPRSSGTRGWTTSCAGVRPARSFAVLVLGVLATFVTPFGPGVWAYAAGIGANPVIAGQVSEWQRTTPFTVTGLLFYVSVVAVAVAMAVGAVGALPRRLGAVRRARGDRRVDGPWRRVVADRRGAPRRGAYR